MITIPVAVNIPVFKWQSELWWWNHQKTYGDFAADKACLLVIDKNYKNETPLDTQWYRSIPHKEATGVWTNLVPGVDLNLCMPLNIQVGLKQILSNFNDDDIIEVTDCDLCHFRPHPEISITEDMLYVCDIYEKWHMFTLTKNRHIIEPYFQHDGKYYNGGFVPIIGYVSTFKKIIHEWEEIHRDILIRPWGNDIKWWAGMFSLQAACEKARVTMVAKDWCYVPQVNQLSESHYTCHYSVDKTFNKRIFPHIDVSKFPDNLFYNRVKEWMTTR